MHREADTKKPWGNPKVNRNSNNKLQKPKLGNAYAAGIVRLGDKLQCVKRLNGQL